MPLSSSDWIKAGTPDTAPVTTSTPAPAATPAADPAPAAATSPSPAPAAGTAAPAPAASTPTPAAPPATTASQAADNAAAAAAAAGASPAAQQAAADKAADDFIMGRVGTTEFKIPKGLEIPWKRGTESGFTPLSQVQTEHMLHRDYSAKTMELAAARRQMELDQRTRAAELEAERKIIAEERERQLKALGSPEEQANYEAYLERYRNDPYFKQQVDDARAGRVRAARDEAVDSYHAEEALVTEAQAVHNAIHEIARSYPGIDPEEITRAYARDLQSNSVPLTRDAIESYFKREQATRDKIAAPFRSEVDSLRAEIATLKEQHSAAAHNDNTRKAMARAQNNVGAPAGGAPAAPANPSANLKGTTLADRSREWSRNR